LLDRVKAQDPKAWGQLAQLYGPLVYQWCRGRGLQAVDAEDVLQEVFLTVAARINDFRRQREGDTFRGWLWVITFNKLGDWMRQQAHRETAVGGSEAQKVLQQHAELETLPATEPSPTGDLYHRALALIRSEFEERTWQAFWRIVGEGQQPANVAADLGMARNAVYLAKSRILRRLREVLGEE
jgi:RNA polymerase sigma-70 factor (ECF subfamily)